MVAMADRRPALRRRLGATIFPAGEGERIACCPVSGILGQDGDKPRPNRKRRKSAAQSLRKGWATLSRTPQGDPSGALRGLDPTGPARRRAQQANAEISASADLT